MHASRFNVLVEDEGTEHILFNTLTGALAVLDDRALGIYRDVSAAEGSEDALPRDVRDRTPGTDGPSEGLRDRDIVDSLVEHGYLVEDGTDETRRSREAFETASQDRSRLILSIVPTYACDFACVYCYQSSAEGAGVMTSDVMDAISGLAERLYARDAFRRLEVQWYGGEPMMRPDVIEQLSERLIGLCEAHGVSYSASMISNCSLVTADAARLLSRCRVESVLATLDCTPQLHNARRIARDGSDSWESVLSGIRNLKAEGIAVEVMANLDEVALGEFPAFRERMRLEEGLTPIPAMLKDYTGAFGTGRFREPDCRLCSSETFSKAAYGMTADEHLRRDDLARALAPAERFCSRQLENYLVIDCAGDVYKCDGWVGHRDRVLFNLRDEVDVGRLHTQTYDPWDDPFCRSCRVLPLCLGACLWDRDVVDPSCSCSVIRYTIEEYVSDYRRCFGAAAGPVCILASGTAR